MHYWLLKSEPNVWSIKSQKKVGAKGAAWDGVTRGLPSDVAPKAIDSVLASGDPDYRAGWWDGFEQCTYIVDWDVV